MTRTPIEIDDIRKGDRIRAEYGADVHPSTQDLRAVEYVANRDGAPWTREATHFLLDRPAPTVELPTEPTLGWLTFYGDTAFSLFRVAGDHVVSSVTLNNQAEGPAVRDGLKVFASGVTAFTPATAVPTEALNMLRAGCFMTVSEAAEVIAHFLAAVDRANGTAS